MVTVNVVCPRLTSLCTKSEGVTSVSTVSVGLEPVKMAERLQKIVAAAICPAIASRCFGVNRRRSRGVLRSGFDSEQSSKHPCS